MKKIILSILVFSCLSLGYAQTKIAEWTFETPGGYNTGIAEHTNGNSIYFTRTDGSNIGPTFSNIQGNYFFGAQNIDGQPDGTYARPEFLTIDNINISGYTNLEFRIHIAEAADGTGEHWENIDFALFNVYNDYMHIDYDIDNSGTFSNLIWVEAAGNASSSNVEPRIDTDFNGLGDGTEITDTFTQFTQNITGTGSFLDIQIEFSFDKQYEDIAIDNIEIWGIGSGSCSTTTTWNGTTWDNGMPNATVNAVLDANYNTQTDGGGFQACNLTVNTGTLSIQGTDYVTVENDITVNGIILVASEASLVQVNDSGNVILGASGDCVLQKTTNIIDDWFDYTYWSSPVNNETVGSVFAGVPSSRIFKYDATNFNDIDNDTFDDDGNDWIVAPPSETLTPGKGYAAVSDALSALPSAQTFTFNGQFNNGNITSAITVSSGANPQNWNFLGNPYPCGLDADLFLTNPLNSSVVGGTLYFWTHNSDPDNIYGGNENLNFTSDDYASYNLSGGISAVSGNAGNNNTIPTGTIASAQGFFVDGLTVGNATFNNAMRVNTGNTSFYRTVNNSNTISYKTVDRVWLNLTNEYGAFSQILVGFNKYATDGFDRLYDGKRFSVNSYLSFYSLLENEKYAIQSKSQFLDDMLIPLGIHSKIQESVPFTLSLERLEGILQETDIYLLDTNLNVEHDLKDSDYSFNISEGEFNDRFVLKFKPQTIYAKEELIIFKDQLKQIRIKTKNDSLIENIQIFDVLGRKVYSQNVNDNNLILRPLNLPNSVLIVRASLQNGLTINKKTIN